MNRFQEIIPVSALLDDELNAVRGGASDQIIAECGGGKKGDLDCDMGKITMSQVQELVACL